MLDENRAVVERIDDSAATTETPSLEWWYMAQFAFGAIHSGFVAILIPTYVISITGKAANVGIIMGFLGLGALLAPAIGNLADRYRAYRAAQLAALGSYVLGALVFAFAGDMLLLGLGAAVLGIGSATLIMINPTFILGARFPQKMESRALTRLNQTSGVGQFLGALAVGSLTQAGLSFSDRFLVMAGVAAFCLLLTAATNREAAGRIQDTPREAVGVAGTGRVPLHKMLASTFGLFLLTTICARAGLDMFFGQYPNYMQNVFQVSPSLSATALAVTALTTLVVLDLGGRWMGRSGPSPVWLTAVGVPVIAAGGLILLATSVPVPVFLPLGMYVILRLCLRLLDLTQPPLAHEMSRAALGTTQGILLGARAIGFMGGNMSGGWLADTLGFHSLPWAVAGLSVVALLLGYLAVNRRRCQHAGKLPVFPQVAHPGCSDGEKSVT